MPAMIIYVAAPYSSKNPIRRWLRYRKANQYAAKLMDEGHIVFSPLSHSVPISYYIGNPTDTIFCIRQDIYWLQYCDEIHILQLRGWQKSKVLKYEVRKAIKLDIPRRYIQQ